LIDALKPYPVMKDSGVPWLGEVPEHWEMRRGKWLFRHKKQLNADRANSNVLSLTLRGVVNNDPENPEGLVPKDYATYQVFSKGDLVFKLIDLENLRTSRVGLVHEDGIMSSAYVRLVPQLLVEIQFFFRQYFDLYQRGIYNQLGAGVRSTLGSADLLDLSVTVPPLPEQAAIVRFLDHADRKIRRYIRAKQKLIKLLEEQKQVIIHRAVTRGLDPNVRLKPSGVEWLGDVPEHWDIERTKNLFRLRTQKSGRAHGLELLSIYTHIGVRPRKDLEEKGNKASTTDDYWIVREGDLIVNKLLAWMGAVGVSEFEGVTSPAYDILMPIRFLCPAFYHHLFRTKLFLQQFKQRSRGIMDMRLRLYFDQLGQIPIVVPPVDEQSAIVAFYSSATCDLDQTIATARLEINLLHEYRTRLIADVVTGKIDVREAAAQLLDDEQALQTVDELDDISDTEEDDLDELDEVIEDPEP
jgi:type I restriction enzyme S subunit